ncbi:hypothetical protein Pa4123_80080 [Phytohabitans aurantiacus]|uniref:Uncharacterized protein n=1 Tax=Phytohabitans aurantiacus TaxID=3016789 RepID=A0ABQ5R7U3_9ACTN|nr:hypothetical protein Pa4123_80080 [Phytohabitans aurantiacus]
MAQSLAAARCGRVHADEPMATAPCRGVADGCCYQRTGHLWLRRAGQREAGRFGLSRVEVRVMAFDFPAPGELVVFASC